MNQPTVLIIGGGFGGLTAAKALARAAVRVVLIDRSNHHLFQPLLYQVATAGLSAEHIAQPIRSILRGQSNLEVVLDEVTGIDLTKREVTTLDICFSYDYLIVAAGARHAYFGNEGWEALAPGLKTLDDALEIRRRVLLAFELAEKARNPDEQKRLLTFVVVGGGPTGVEMAGAIAELARFTLRRDFRRIDPRSARVVLVEAGPRLLSSFDPSLSERALADLKKLHVEVRINSSVKALDPEFVTVNDENIFCHTVVWAAGNVASPLAALLGDTDRQGRLQVNPDLTLTGHPEVQAVGDMVSFVSEGKPVPGVSPAAMQAGQHAAENVLRMLDGKKPTAWKYFDKGSMATIGRNAAVCQAGPLKFGGFLAWLAWAFVHLFFLIGLRSRTSVFMQWIWAYLFYSKGARLIAGVPGKEGVLAPEGNRNA